MIIQTEHKLEQLENGYTTTVKRFAWLPVFIGNCWVWLERYEVLKGYFYQNFQVGDNVFVVGKWVELSKRVAQK